MRRLATSRATFFELSIRAAARHALRRFAGALIGPEDFDYGRFSASSARRAYLCRTARRFIMRIAPPQLQRTPRFLRAERSLDRGEGSCFRRRDARRFRLATFHFEFLDAFQYFRWLAYSLACRHGRYGNVLFSSARIYGQSSRFTIYIRASLRDTDTAELPRAVVVRRHCRQRAIYE